MIEDRKILKQKIIQIFITVRNQTEMVEALISEGANVNNQDQCLEIGILFQIQFSSTYQDSSGMTCIMEASFWGKTEILKKLLEAKPDLSFKDHEGQ